MNRRAARQASPGSAISRSVFGRSVPSGAIFRIALIAVLAIIGLSCAHLYAESAGSDYKRGQSAEAREDYDAAVDFYQKAAAKAPKDIAYRTALYRVRVSASGMHMAKGRKLLQAGDEQAALTEYMRAAEIDPGNEAAQQEIAKVRQKHGEISPQTETSLPQAPGAAEELESMGSPVQLKPMSNEPLTLHMTEDAKVIYQAVGKAAGINVLFDPDYTAKRVQVDLANMTLLDALRVVGTMSNTFWRPVTSNTIFVAANNPTKRREQDDQAVQTFYLTNAWQQNDLNDVVTAIRNVLTGQTFKVYGVPSQNAIIVRGTPDELLVAQMLIDDLDKARAEVVVDIAVMEVSKNWERNLGISWPSSIGAAIQPPSSSSSSSCTPSATVTCPASTGTTPTLYSLAHLQASDFAITVGSATANLLLTDSKTKILDNPRIRSTDGQKSTMKIGEKIPIATGSYGGGGVGTGALGGISSLVNTQFQYQDVGVNIEMTPTVHYDHDVTLKIVIEVTSQTGSVTISQVTEPILSQRKIDQVIRLREGEASILGGIQDKQDQASWSGIPGLSSIPGLKYLFGSKDHTISDDELVFLVVPHIVRTQSLDRANLRTIDLGVGTSIELRHMPVPAPGQAPGENPGSNPAPAAVPARPIPPPRSTVGTVPGQSAIAAAPAALAQLSESADANSSAANAARQPNAANAPDPRGPDRPPMPVNMRLNGPTAPVAAGSTFQVPIELTGGKDIGAVGAKIQYDPAKLSLVNVISGSFLNRDGQAADPIHSDPDGTGSLTINASRPPGAAGVNGAGVVYVLSFQAKVAGETALVLTSTGISDSTHKPVPAQGSQINIVVK